jgi:hypothetical protein
MFAFYESRRANTDRYPRFQNDSVNFDTAGLKPLAQSMEPLRAGERVRFSGLPRIEVVVELVETQDFSPPPLPPHGRSITSDCHVSSLTPFETTFWRGTAFPSPAGRGQGEGGLGFSPLGDREAYPSDSKW